MTLPNGIDGISEAIGTLFASGGPLTPVPNAATWGANPISQMNTLTQAAVTEKVKQNQILNSTGWNATTSALYEGLRRGNPSDGNVPLITSSLEAMVNGLFGTSIHFPSNAEVIAAIERVPLMTELIDALQSIYKGLTGQESVSDVLADLNTDIQNALSELQSQTGQFLDTVLVDLGLPTSEASAFAAWLSGSAAGQRITNVSSAVIVNGNQQLLESPNFSGAISVAGNGIWTLNTSIYYVIPGETVDEPGSAQVTANGTTQILTSTPAEDIPLGQPVDYSIHVCTDALTGSGTLLQIVAVPWIGDTAQTPVVLASSGAPTGATTGWTGAPTGSKATVISGVYTPPVGSGITAVSMQLVLTNAALSGTVYWSAASEELTGGLINDLMNENAAGQAASATYWTSLNTAVNQVLGGNWSGGITTAENAWQTYQVAQAGVASAQYVTLHQLLSMVGINTSSGMMTATNVTSALGGTSLGADVSTTAARTARKAQNDQILSDWAHTIYPLGSSTDTAATRVGGKPTWWGANNDSWTLLEEELGIIPPSTIPSDIGTTVAGHASSIATNATNITAAQSTASTAQSAASAAQSGLNATNTNLFGSTTPATTIQTAAVPALPATKITNVLGGTNLSDDLTKLATSLFGADTVGALTTVENDIANFIVNALTGGNAPTSSGSPVAYLEGLLGFIPHTNVVIPPNPGTGTIAHDATAHLTPISTFVTAITGDWNHTCAVGVDYLTVRLAFYSSGNFPIVAVNYFGQQMQLLASDYYYDFVGHTYCQTYGLANPYAADGTPHPVEVYIDAPYGDVGFVAAVSDSYIGVDAVGVVVTGNGNGSNPALTIPSVTNNVVVQSVHVSNTLGSVPETVTPTAAAGHTTQYNSGSVYWGSGNNASSLVAVDAAGATSVSFADTASYFGSKEWWAATAVNLVPKQPDVLGSTFRAANTSTANVPATIGHHLLPNNFFNSIQTISDDLTYNAANANMVTITHAGTYAVTVALMVGSTYAGYFLGPDLYRNGALVDRGHTGYIGATNPDTVMAFTFQIYCSTGDTLQPGYYSGVTYPSTFVGEANGTYCYFKVALANRGVHS